MNIYIVENNKIVGTNNYPDIDDRDCIVVDGVRSELEDIDQVDGVYYYEKINNDQSITNYTTVTKVAKFLSWQDNTVLISDTEVSELNGWTYLKGYAPKKSEEQKLNELATEIRSKRNLLLAETDYLLMPDYPISEEYLEKVKEYRQQLRDITEQENFPTIVVFPEFPKEN